MTFQIFYILIFQRKKMIFHVNILPFMIHIKCQVLFSVQKKTKLEAQVGQKSLTWIRLFICYIVPWWPSWMLDQIATKAPIFEIGTERFSNSDSPCHSDTSHQVSAQSDLLFGSRGDLKIFKMAAMVARLEPV